MEEISKRQRRRLVAKRAEEDLGRELGLDSVTPSSSQENSTNISFMLSEDIEEIDCDNSERPFIEYISDIEEESEEIYISSKSDEIPSLEGDTCNKLRTKLAWWALRYGISTRAVNDLLLILREEGLANLPMCKEGLIPKLHQDRFNVIDQEDGSYMYIGIKNNILMSDCEYLRNCTEVVCDFNIDGLPLYKSSKKSVWPILGSFSNNNKIPPFVVGAWVGSGHPSSAEKLLADFANEISALKASGITFPEENLYKPFKIRAIICDAPAKSFCKCVKYHNSHYGCHECEQVGFTVKHTTIYNVTSGTLRTDESFKNRRDIGHHNEQNLTVLERASVNMVSQFPLDSMHLVDLGLTKKILQLILTEFSKPKVQKLSESYEILSLHTPSEFSRRPRSFLDITRWKATEFRFFILYGFFAALKDQISEDKFYHLCLLSTSLRLLSDENNCKNNIQLAQTLINQFVELFAQLYGLRYISYNVHSILHLPSYVGTYGPIHSFSGYKYENFMQEIKKSIKSPVNILKQLRNRILERYYVKEKLPEGYMKKSNNKTFEFDSFIFQNNIRDSCCAIKISEVTVPFLIEEVKVVNGERYIVGRRFLHSEPYFTEPINSELLGIVQVSQLSQTTETYAESVLSGKYCRLPLNSLKTTWLLISMLHESTKVNFV